MLALDNALQLQKRTCNEQSPSAPDTWPPGPRIPSQACAHLSSKPPCVLRNSQAPLIQCSRTIRGNMRHQREAGLLPNFSGKRRMWTRPGSHDCELSSRAPAREAGSGTTMSPAACSPEPPRRGCSPQSQQQKRAPGRGREPAKTRDAGDAGGSAQGPRPHPTVRRPAPRPGVGRASRRGPSASPASLLFTCSPCQRSQAGPRLRTQRSGAQGHRRKTGCSQTRGETDVT